MAEHFDRDAERSALGAMLLDSRRVWDVLDVAKPADFHDPHHEVIAEAVRRLASRGEGTDPVLAWDEISAMGASIPQGAAYLHELTSWVSSAASGAFYASIVRDHATRRRLAAAGARVVQLAGDATVEPDEVVEQARAVVDSVAAGGVREVVAVIDEIDETFAGMSEPPVYTATPWPQINHLIGGLRPRAMYVVGARPAGGKSILAMNAAVALAGEGAVAVCSMEMGREELHKRLVAQLGRVHMSALMNNALEDDDWKRVATAREQLRGLHPIVIDDTPGQTLARVRSHVRSTARMAEAKGTKLAGVVVDYLQLMESSDPRRDRRVQVGEFSRGMKLIAKEFDCPVVALSQLNRKSEERVSRRPVLSDLREAGDLEQDADVVLLLARDPDDMERAGELDVIVAKNRHGSTGDVVLAWMGHFATLEDAGGGWEPWG